MATPCSAAQSDGDPAQHAQAGLAFAHARNWPQAEAELNAAVAAAPKVAAYRAQLGSILGLQGKWQEALASIQKAVALDPQNLAFRREVAAVEWQVSQFDAANEQLQFILRKQPGDPGATLLLGLVEDARGDHEHAAKLFASQFDLAVAEPVRAVAFCRSELQSNQRAELPKINDVLAQHATDPGWSSAISLCAQYAIAVPDLSTAERLVSLLPQPDGKVLLSLANAYTAQKNFNAAIKTYSRAIELDPHSIAAYTNLSALLLAFGRSVDALATANRAVQALPENSQAWILKGNAQIAIFSYEDATESYTKAAKIDPSNADAALGLASSPALAGETDTAIARYKEGAEHFPNDSRFYLNCAETMMASPMADQFREQAAALLKQAVQLDPNSARIHYQLGQLALQQGRFTEAEQELLTSIKLGPSDSAAHYALSLVYRRSGRKAESEAQFKLYQNLKASEESSDAIASPPAGNP